MTILNLNIPDTLSELHQHDTEILTSEVQVGFIVWEYLNGHLSLSESAAILNIPYRIFLEMLWRRGIPLDGLTPEQLDEQVNKLLKLNIF